MRRRKKRETSRADTEGGGGEMKKTECAEGDEGCMSPPPQAMKICRAESAEVCPMRPRVFMRRKPLPKSERATCIEPISYIRTLILLPLSLPGRPDGD